MAIATKFYQLKKPAPEDFYSVADQNGNMDAVDAALHGLEQGKAALGPDGKVPVGQLPEMNYEGPIKNAGTKAELADGDGMAIADSADVGKTKRVLWSTVKAALAAADIDCGTFDALTPVAAHNRAASAHGGMVVDGNAVAESGGSGDLAAHENDPLAHQNIILDGNLN